MHGLPLWAVSIGLIVAGEPTLGVIAIPPLKELFWAVKGGGAWLDGHRLAARDADEFHNQDNVCVGTNALRAIDTRTLPGRLRDLGSACCEQTFVAANRLQATTMLGRTDARYRRRCRHRQREAGCGFATLTGERLSPAEMVRRTPITVPTFIAPPRRLEALLAMARSFDLGSRPFMDYWGVKSYENDGAADALDAGFDRAHGSRYEELMDDRNPLTFEQVQQRLADLRTLEASIEALAIRSIRATRPTRGTIGRGWLWSGSWCAMPSWACRFPNAGGSGPSTGWSTSRSSGMKRQPAGSG